MSMIGCLEWSSCYCICQIMYWMYFHHLHSTLSKTNVSFLQSSYASTIPLFAKSTITSLVLWTYNLEL